MLYRRPFGSTAAFESWTQVCVSEANTIPLAEVEEGIHEELFARIGEPVANVNPGDGTLVNLPVIFWTDSPADIGFDVTQPVPGALVATPTHQWTTSDGATLDGPGRPYDGTDPRRDLDYYLDHAFTEHGDAWIELTTTWNAEFTVTGNGPIDIDPITVADRINLPVAEATNVLTDR